MTGCRSHGDLIGPYVLGGLEPAEMDEMTGHLAGCERCAAERRRLASLPRCSTARRRTTRSPRSPPQLEDAVLDRFVSERAQAARPRRRLARFAIPAAAALTVALVAVLALVLPGGGDQRAYASAELWSTSGRVLGSASVAEVAGGTHVQLRAHDLPVGHGTAYELWCVRTDGRWINGGASRGADGSASAQLTVAVRPGDYHVIVVTRPSAGGKHGPEVMRGKLIY